MKYRLLKGTLMTDELERVGFVPGDILNSAMVTQLGGPRLSALLSEGIVEVAGDDASEAAPRSLLEGAL